MTIREKVKKGLSYLTALLGAIGVGLQNYVAVELFIRAIISGTPLIITKSISKLIQGLAIGFGGVSSALVNFYINIGLLDDFLDRIIGDKKNPELSGWRKFRYRAGIVVFLITGVLFGLTAFTFGMITPFAALALAAGIFTTVIMTIQEVETWLKSFDDEASPNKQSLKAIFKHWKDNLTVGKAVGHLIAAGNVLALSLLFTLGLAEFLMMLHVAALPALIVGLVVAFTFGAFTEFYFYNFFLAAFCEKIKDNWHAMLHSRWAGLGFACITSNALVNGALTYTGVMLFTGVLIAAGIALPPIGVLIALSSISAVFAATASFCLGMDFWIGKKATDEAGEVTPAESRDEAPVKPWLPLLSGNQNQPEVKVTNTPGIGAKGSEKSNAWTPALFAGKDSKSNAVFDNGAGVVKGAVI